MFGSRVRCHWRVNLLLTLISSIIQLGIRILFSVSSLVDSSFELDVFNFKTSISLVRMSTTRYLISPESVVGWYSTYINGASWFGR